MRIGAHLAGLGLAAILSLDAVTADVAARSVGPAPSVISDIRPTSEAEAFVQSKVDKGIAILNDSSLNADEQRIEFRAFLLTIVDTRRIAIFTLGVHARDASDGDIDNFVSAYTNFVTALYQNYFDKSKGEIVRVTGATRRSDDDVIVHADVVGRDGAHKLKIAFRVRRGQGQKDIVTDLQIEGAWLVLNQRIDFSSYFQQHGGMLASLSSELESRAERIAEEMKHALHAREGDV
jgi:ABC-type transporter MlaC component